MCKHPSDVDLSPGTPRNAQISRRGDWQSRLSEYVVAVARQPFKYGELDCGLFVAGAIEAMTGVDVAAELRVPSGPPAIGRLRRGDYASRRQAFGRISAACGSPSMARIADHLAAKFGIREVPVQMAQRGDAVQLKRGRASSLGIVAMHGFEVMTPYRDGILRVPMRLAVRAWHI
jgi:hypothetical protein